MKIQKIEKKKRLYLIELDNGQKLYVTEDTIVRFMLSKDTIITEEELKDITSFAQFSHGKNLALYFISFQQRTQKEVQDYLLKHDIDSRIVPQIMTDLINHNWVNDQSYAQSYIRQNQLSGDKGPLVLKQKLQLKGITSDILLPLLEEESFLPIAEKVAQKLYQKQAKRLPLRALKEKINQNLLQKGFSYQQTKQAIEQLDFNEPTEDLYDLLDKEFDKQYRKYSRKFQGYDLKQKLYQALYRKGFDNDDIKSKLREYF
ncbi:recombination regulator RecX [Streptococcus ictaluri]|nr:recombination regulator RecX [Streptococcus ictaluri]